MYSGLNEAPDAIISVGDTVVIKPIEWYKANANRNGVIILEDGVCFVNSMARLCGKELVVQGIRKSALTCNAKHYPVFTLEGGMGFSFTNKMFSRVIHKKQ